MASAQSPIPGTPPDVLLAMVARRLYMAALAIGKTKEMVPALGALEPLTKAALELAPEPQQRFAATMNSIMYLFEMDRMAADLLMLGIGMELDERIYYAAMKITAAPPGALGPRIGSLLSLLYPTVLDRQAAMHVLLNDAPLIRYRMVRLLGDPDAPLSQREFSGEPSLVAHLSGEISPGLPGSLIGLADLILPATDKPVENSLPPDLERMLSLLTLEETPVRRLHIHPLARRAALPMAERIAQNQGRPVIMLDLRTVPKSMDDPVSATLRETRLRHGIPMFLNPLSTGDEEASPLAMDRVAQHWRRALASERDLVIFVSESREANDIARLERVGLDLVEYKVLRSNLSGRQTLFANALDRLKKSQLGGISDVKLANDINVRDLASVYRVDEGDINAIVQHALINSELRALEEGQAPVITAEDVWSSGREQTRRDIGKFATLVRSSYTWDDLVLPDDVMEQLSDMYHAARSRAFVYENWGYSKKHMRGLGLCAIFSGDSGTGKTMSAEVIANMLKVNMYRIDMSMVVSKWLGETEKNLSEIFSATEATDAILFFDEAESLFGKRTEVKDARDRYANMETGYMLQRIETYDGIVILSTNLRGNVDKAFLRRMQFGINFEMPEEAMRRQLWRKAFPTETPLAPDVDFDLLARKYEELSGGQIKLISIGASMIAASEGAVVTSDHIHRAFVIEMYKQQKLVNRELEEGAPRRPRRERTLAGVTTRSSYQKKLT